MANVAVTCIKNGRSDSFGRPLVSGTYYPSVEIETAKALWNSGYVSVADASVFDQDPLAGTSPLDDFNISRALSLSRQPAQTSANLAAEIAALQRPPIISVLALPDTVQAPLGSSENLLAQAIIPAGLAKNMSRAEVTVVLRKTGGTSDTLTARIRAGSSGTVADSTVVSVALPPSSISWNYKTGVLLLTDGFRQVGLNTGVIPLPGASTSDVAAKQTVPGMLSGDVYVSFYTSMSSGVTERAELVVFDVDLRL